MNSSNSLFLLRAWLTIFVFIVVFGAGASSAAINTKTVISDLSAVKTSSTRYNIILIEKRINLVNIMIVRKEA